MEKDRVKPYFEALLRQYVFNELSDDFLQKMNAEDLLQGVPVPIKASDFLSFRRGNSLTVLDIARAVGIAAGAVPDFLYIEAYQAFLHRIFQGRAEEVLVNEGYAYLKAGKLLEAACFFRAAIQCTKNSRDALYSYALCCREIYTAAGTQGIPEGLKSVLLNNQEIQSRQNGAAADEQKERKETEAFIAKFKAESMETLERLTVLHPEFAFAYYYLGYAYLNLGLYTKAYLTWNDFLEKVRLDPLVDEVQEEVKEIEERLLSLAVPMEIEAGVAAVTAGRYHEGIEILSRYTESAFASWWPMHYYLGIAYESIGEVEAAIISLRRALSLSPSNIEVMDELTAVYRAIGDRENEIKYARKIEIVKRNYAEEAEQSDK